MLKYTFHAYMRDGSVIRQTPEDVSPNALGKSAFWDVAERLDDVCVFSLNHGDELSVLVRLHDGAFYFGGGGWFYASSAGMQERPLPAGGRFRLQYFRRVSREIRQGGETLPIVTSYNIGWDYFIGGQKLATQVITIY